MTKFDKLGVLKQEISFAVLKARSLNSRCQQDNAPSKDSREKILPCLFQTVGDFRSSLAYDSIPPSLASTILWPFPLYVSVWSIFSSSHKETNHTGCRAHSNLVWPHPNLTNYICKDVFPIKVIFWGSGKTWFWGEGTIHPSAFTAFASYLQKFLLQHWYRISFFPFCQGVLEPSHISEFFLILFDLECSVMLLSNRNIGSRKTEKESKKQTLSNSTIFLLFQHIPF